MSEMTRFHADIKAVLEQAPTTARSAGRPFASRCVAKSIVAAAEASTEESSAVGKMQGALS